MSVEILFCDRFIWFSSYIVLRFNILFNQSLFYYFVASATDPPVGVLTRDFQVTNVTITWKKDEDAVKYYVEVTSHFNGDQTVKTIYESKGMISIFSA